MHELTERFADRGLRKGPPPDSIASFQPSHPELADLTVRARKPNFNVEIEIDPLFRANFTNHDTHLDVEFERRLVSSPKQAELPRKVQTRSRTELPMYKQNGGDDAST